MELSLSEPIDPKCTSVKKVPIREGTDVCFYSHQSLVILLLGVGLVDALCHGAGSVWQEAGEYWEERQWWQSPSLKTSPTTLRTRRTGSTSLPAAKINTLQS